MSNQFFFNGFLKEKVYIEQPMIYEVKEYGYKILKLNKSLYGLKQVSRAWYSHIDGHFLENGFVKCLHEYTIYVKIKKKWRYSYCMFVCGWLILYRK
jgi:hypothetical protein